MLIGKYLGFEEYENENGKKISIEDQEDALLRIFHLAGYFHLTKIWKDWNSMGFFENLQEIFEKISFIIKCSNANHNDPNEFNVKYFRENVFEKSLLNDEDCLDWILYLSQHAFGRSIGQERYEMKSLHWIHQNEHYFIEQVRLLRLVDRQCPILKQFDQCWIAGASRLSLSQRILDYKYQILSKNIQINGQTLILAGERELWANIDGISPKISEELFQISKNHLDINQIDFSSIETTDSEIIQEGKEYLLNLSRIHGIELNSSQPFIEYQTKDQCSNDRFPNRIYLNYENSQKKLTETLLSEDLIKTYLEETFSSIEIVDTSANEQIRPNTASTAQDATEKFIQQIFNGDFREKKLFHILLWSNNPSIERQTLVTQRKVNSILEKSNLIENNYKISIHGIGCSSNVNLEIVHSELGALITEKYLWLFEQQKKQGEIKKKRNINDLLFQTRK
ncbi:unnamed protein product [Adineta ricciae]|uniref:Uncharacterized protein n=1 Tax=Adineta ricciae TaxID=249248 RepID=A0A815JXP9_ADIRI|nr:unnamed protein product [Adineta ricciae]CAF1578948.1 unnamed protein product [Adineta ricciae]